MTSNISPDQYVLRFGKYNKLKAVDVLKITEIDKNGKVKPAGYLYLKWLVEKADWFRHKEIIEEILDTYESTLSDTESETVEEVKKPKPTEKKLKKTKEGTVKISTEKSVLDFQ